MLVRLYGENFRSFRDPFELSMVAADLKNADDRDRGVVEVPLAGSDEPLRLLRVAALYGPNASGKSNVLLAARALRWLIFKSSPETKPNQPIIPYEPFILSEATKPDPVKLGCDIAFRRGILRYEIKFDARKIIQENLRHITHEIDRLLIDRHEDAVTGELIDSSEANRLYVEGMQPNVAVVSKLAQHGPSRGGGSIQPQFHALQAALGWQDFTATAYMSFIAQDLDRLASDEGYRDWILSHLMVEADLGIIDIRHERKTLPDYFAAGLAAAGIDPDSAMGKFDFFFKHRGAHPESIALDDESAGTRKLFYMSGSLWRLAHHSETLFADELGASLHPRLLDQLIRAVNEPSDPEIRSQLIFATHDTGLLEGRDGMPPALRRDQVYFTKKDHASGASELYSLAEFKDDARRVHNIRKRYLSGLYGALPHVEGISL